MSNTNYAITAKLRSVKDGWIFNLIKGTSKLTIRVLIPFEEFKNKYPDAVITSTITDSDLLSETLIFEDIRCNFQENSLYSFSKNEIEYVLLYESYINLDEIKDAGCWINGNIASIYMPIIGSVFEYRGMYSYIFAFNHYQDALMKLSTQALATKMRRSLMVECIAHFAVYDNTLDFLNTPVVLHLPSNVTVITNINDVQNVADKFDIGSLLPQYSVVCSDTINPDQTITARVNATFSGKSHPINTELTLVAKSGYIPVQTISLINGTASFKVSSMGLQVGDKLSFDVYEHNRLCAQTQINVIES